MRDFLHADEERFGFDYLLLLVIAPTLRASDSQQENNQTREHQIAPLRPPVFQCVDSLLLFCVIYGHFFTTFFGYSSMCFSASPRGKCRHANLGNRVRRRQQYLPPALQILDGQFLLGDFIRA